jgi:magnesium transporter
MLSAYIVVDQKLQLKPVRQPADLTEDVRWLDLNNPTEQERQWVRAAYGQEVLYIEELGEIEASARHYHDEHGLHLHLYFLKIEDRTSRNIDVAFTVNKERLFTLHAEECAALKSYYAHASAHPELSDDAMCILFGIVSTRLGLLADTFERLETELETLSGRIFSGNSQTMASVLEGLARVEDRTGKARLGLIENQRVFSALAHGKEGKDHAESIAEILRDADSLLSHSVFLFDRVKFMMDSTLGMINIGHSTRLNVFTVLSVLLMPPMLIVSIYGMNFKHMPELDWKWGYPFALVLVVLSGLVPYLMLKRKGWLQ